MATTYGTFGVEWTDPATSVLHRVTFPRDAMIMLAAAVASNAVDKLAGPGRVYPGGSDDHATMPDGSILTLGVNGEVYRDGQQLPGVAARQIIQFGTSLYAQGKTVPSWWRWTGAAWVAVTAFDPAVLNDIPPATP